jgi:rSAM/selenodomain-associated transferase 1
MQVAVAIMAKQPVAGSVKTRLCPPLTPEEAASLYRCFLLDKLDQVRRLRTVSPWLAYTPQEADGFFRRLAGEGFCLTPQEGRDLGQRLARLSEQLLAAGHPAVVIIDSDTPSLPDSLLADAIEQLGDPRTDAVLGPAEDGGYYLVGLRRPAPALFDGVAWSTPAVLSETLARAAAQGLRVRLLSPWFDVDTGDDLERLRVSLEANGTPAIHTRSFLRTRLAGPWGGRLS